MINKKRKSLNCVYIDILRMMLYPLAIILPILLSDAGIGENASTWITLGVLVVLFIFYGVYKIFWGIRNIITGVKLTKAGDSESLGSFMKTAKFGSIPLYVIVFIINFLMWSLLLIASRGIGIFSFLFMIAPTVFFTYLNVIFTSVFSICFLIDKKNKGEISAVSMVVHILLQLCFVIDVIDTIYLCAKFGKRKIFKSDYGDFLFLFVIYFLFYYALSRTEWLSELMGYMLIGSIVLYGVCKLVYLLKNIRLAYNLYKEENEERLTNEKIKRRRKAHKVFFVNIIIGIIFFVWLFYFTGELFIIETIVCGLIYALLAYVNVVVLNCYGIAVCMLRNKI